MITIWCDNDVFLMTHEVMMTREIWWWLMLESKRPCWINELSPQATKYVSFCNCHPLPNFPKLVVYHFPVRELQPVVLERDKFRMPKLKKKSCPLFAAVHHRRTLVWDYICCYLKMITNSFCGPLVPKLYLSLMVLSRGYPQICSFFLSKRFIIQYKLLTDWIYYF